ncbi:hypothetical protein MKW92_013087 [Papaver armeniacum]|nr:hypothetical protein MKW92_013087 [Papaver armeniacum]
MAKAELAFTNNAVHRLQLALLEGIRDENKLYAAGSFISKRDYEDVVTERSISNVYGYPLCKKSLPLERPRKGRYRISLREHKVYDLQEMYMYCSSECVVNSLAFWGSLQDEALWLVVNLMPVILVFLILSYLILKTHAGVFNSDASHADHYLPQQMNGSDTEMVENALEPESAPLNWRTKPGVFNFELFDPENSWFEPPPEGFNLSLSPFATMYMALFGWVTSSSLAYIYGRDEDSQEEFLSVNGRSYPCKIVLSDGRSSEIKHTLSGCLSRALPGLVMDLRLPAPVSFLEQGMSRLQETMSFINALPSFRMKLIVLDGAQIISKENELLKDHIIPLGRLPQFSTNKVSDIFPE